MRRTLSFIGSILVTATLFSASAPPAYASAGAPDYRLTASAEASGNQVAAETLWRCSAGACVAQNSGSRPAIVCAQAARKLGKLETFEFRGSAFDADSLAKCNAKAR